MEMEYLWVPIFMILIALYVKLMSGDFDLKHLAEAAREKREAAEANQKAAEANLEAERLRSDRMR